MKKLILLALSVFPLRLFAQESFEIKGEIGNWNAPARVYLVYMVNDTRVVDSTKIANGRQGKQLAATIEGLRSTGKK
jgi:hypothetical protein